jgi:hypothetical protein
VAFALDREDIKPDVAAELKALIEGMSVACDEV